MAARRDRQRPDEAKRAQPEKVVRICVIDPNCLEDLQIWAEDNPKILGRILTLMEQVLREPFTGIGKPEPLKSLGPNIWSRRVTQEHRLVYVVANERITFLQARYHY